MFKLSLLMWTLLNNYKSFFWNKTNGLVLLCIMEMQSCHLFLFHRKVRYTERAVISPFIAMNYFWHMVIIVYLANQGLNSNNCNAWPFNLLIFYYCCLNTERIISSWNGLLSFMTTRWSLKQHASLLLHYRPTQWHSC